MINANRNEVKALSKERTRLLERFNNEITFGPNEYNHEYNSWGFYACCTERGSMQWFVTV